jgi:hypothetical protein
MLNNTDNNNTAIQYILNKLELYNMHEEKHCRLYYLGYIINLTTQNFIFSQNLEKWL